jgi:hypothetical protein
MGDSNRNLTRACEFEDGYVFLPRCEEFPSPLTIEELVVLKAYWMAQHWPNIDSWPNAVCRWAKLRLPNGQKARSVWHESNVAMKPCCASCVDVRFFDNPPEVLSLTSTLQIKREDGIRIGNVQFYFCIRFGKA